MKKITTSILAFSLFAAPAFALAQDAGTAVTGATTNQTQESSASKKQKSTATEPGGPIENRMAAAKQKAHDEIARRIESMAKLAQKIDGMKKLSQAQKNTLKADLTKQTSDLTALDAKITADTDLATLKTDVASIAKSYRIFLLIIPRDAIFAAADRVLTVSDKFVKNAQRLSGDNVIAMARATYVDVAILTAARDAVLAKIVSSGSEATTVQGKIQTAVDKIASLTPDNGDKTKADGNKESLQSARALIVSAQQDLVSIRPQAELIAKVLKQIDAGNQVPPPPPPGTNTP